ncbi:DUF1127 domain-containing protein [Rhizobium sp. KVB221]|uniref:DUF1127 domain-containing protein n=1 Tax=Rhizobium setariae TaxID=2801340 RepID=A0A937CIS9_9HYPH|nr:DUF1127 domain-containing protein [Rhizobium setariae]MBL0370415.1 DUF1127 domain-containing protein [Rhizobium setariae]
MSTLEHAPVCATAGREERVFDFGLSAALRTLLSLARAVRGRRAVLNMREFDDAQLADIGLKRSDVEVALLSPLTSDPSRSLVSARQNPLRGIKRF